MILPLLLAIIFIVSSNGLLVYKPDEGKYLNGTSKPNLFFKFELPSLLNCDITDTKTIKLHPEKYDCDEQLTWHFEHIKTAFVNSTTNNCEEMNVVSMISKKYIMPINYQLQRPIRIRPITHQGKCGKGYMEGFNFFSYKLNNNKNIWEKANNSPSLRVLNKYPPNVTEDEHALYEQMFMYGMQIGTINSTLDSELENASHLVDNGTMSEDEFKNIFKEKLSTTGNSIFRKSCKMYNDLIDLMDSPKDITKIISLYLDKKDIKAERTDNGIIVKQCKILDTNSIKFVPLINPDDI